MYNLKELLVEKDGYVRGPFGSALRKADMKIEGIPVYEQQHVISEKRKFRYFISYEKFENMKRFTTKPNDLLISCSGTVGEISKVSEDDPIGIINQALLKIRVREDLIHPKYLLYFFKSYKGKNSLIQKSTGSVQINIASRQTIESIKIKVPSMTEQLRIIKKIESIESKIELNRVGANKLEEYSQLLFHKWFIDFNFPNENGKPYKDSGGEIVEVDEKLIPKDWPKNSLEHFIEETFNGDWGKEDYYEGAVNTHCIRGADMPNIKRGVIGDTPLRYIKSSKNRYKKLKHGNIVIEASGGSPTQSTGRTVLIRDSLLKRINKPLYFSNFSKAITPKPGYSMFLYHLLNNLYNRDVFFHYEGKTSGLKNLLIKNLIKRVKFPSPPIKLLREFEKETGVLWDKIFNLGHENELLEETKELLIHKLIK